MKQKKKKKGLKGKNIKANNKWIGFDYSRKIAQ